MSLKRATISRETLASVWTFVAFGLQWQALRHFLRFFMGHHLPFRSCDERDTHELSLERCDSWTTRPPTTCGAKRGADTGIDADCYPFKA